MTRTMADSTNPDDIPAGFDLVMGYVDGPESEWPAAGWQKWPDAVRCSVVGHPDATVYDVESGDLTPADCPRVIQASTSPRPTIYCSRSALDACRAAMVGAPRQADYLVADWTGTPHSIPGTIGTQYANPAQTGHHYDLSIITDDTWPGPGAPQPQPTPSPGGTVTVTVDLPVLQSGATGAPVKKLQGLLVATGASIAIDGSFGPQTHDAVVAFQHYAGLATDGVVGAQTWPALLTR